MRGFPGGAAANSEKSAQKGKNMTQEKKQEKLKITLILAAGVLLRLLYVLFSTIYDRQYDIGVIDLDAGHTVSGGHLAYIQYLYENWRLPDCDPTTIYQFHHPPLHHYLCALWMKFCSFFVNNTDKLEELIQVVPFVGSLLTLYFLYKIVKCFDLKARTEQFVMTIFAFHPTLILFAGSVNNDCLGLLFTVLCVYTTILWEKDPTIKNILKIALSIGLGMITKLNVAEMAFPIGLIFLYMLIRTCQKKTSLSLGKLAFQFAAFLAVSLPLGLSFTLRNYSLYDVSPVWVYTLPEDSWQYIGNVPVINRFLWPNLKEMADNLLHFKIGCGYNVWFQIARTSVLGEWDMASVGKLIKIPALLLMFSGILLAAAAFAAFLRVFCSKKYKISTPLRSLFLSGYLTNLLFYLKFVYDYPQECSMNFRYIAITLLFPAVGLGIFSNQSLGKKGRLCLNALLLCFCVLSAVMTGIWCVY